MSDIIYRYRFEVIIQDNHIKEICKMMRKLDLDMGEIGIEQVFTFSTKLDTSISKIKDHIRECIEANEMTLLKIEGGRIE